MAIKKNSGWLRFTFGAPGGPGAAPQFPALLEGASPNILVCLGADAEITVDADGQVFGPSPGHAAITGAASSLFTGQNLLARDADPTGEEPDRTRIEGYIPSGTKVRAFFQATDGSTETISGIEEYPFVVVQTEVTESAVRGGGAVTGLKQFLGAIRVAIQNQGAGGGTSVAGTLWVEIQHSLLDIPGLTSQSAQFPAISVG